VRQAACINEGCLECRIVDAWRDALIVPVPNKTQFATL